MMISDDSQQHHEISNKLFILLKSALIRFEKEQGNLNNADFFTIFCNAASSFIYCVIEAAVPIKNDHIECINIFHTLLLKHYDENKEGKLQ